MRVTIQGQTLDFLAEKAVFWQETRALILSDVHLGKSAVFRHAGIPVPEGEMAMDLGRLSHLIATHQPSQLIIVGDLCHAPAARSPGLRQALTAWRATHAALAMTLVQGNHDRDARLAAELRLSVQPQLHAGPFAFRHDPADSQAAEFTISGHLHPTVCLPGTAGRQFRAPCFWLRPQQLILPSFGSFTGGKEITLTAEETAYAVAQGQVLEIPGKLWAK